MKKSGKKFTAGILIGVLAASSPFSALSGTINVHAESITEDEPLTQEMPEFNEGFRSSNANVDENKSAADSLKLAVAEAGKLEQQQKDYNCFTAESWERVQEALDEARAMLEKPELTQEEIDKAFLKLITACDLLEDSVQKVGLKTAIDGAKAILEDGAELSGYTPESIEAVKAALAEAEKNICRYQCGCADGQSGKPESDGCRYQYERNKKAVKGRFE